MTKLRVALAAVAALCLLVGPAWGEPVPKPKPRPTTIEQIIDPSAAIAAPPAAITAAPVAAAPVPPPEPGGSAGLSGAVKEVATNIAVQILTWLGVLVGGILTASAVPISAYVVMILKKKLEAAGIQVSDADRARIQELVVNGLHAGAAVLPKDPDGKVTSGAKGKLLEFVQGYVQAHGADALKRLGIPADSDEAQEVVSTRAEVALADPKVPVSVGEPAGPEKGPMIPVVQSAPIAPAAS